MKIEEIETFLVHQWLLVRIQTDKGISGIGEATFFPHPEAVIGVLNTFRDYLRGQDPLRIDHHWQFLYRFTSFRGAAIMAALSAIDIALWDIAGKFYRAPVCNLLGGRCRDKIRMCALVLTDEIDALVAGVKQAVAEGHTAVKIDPVARGFPRMANDRLVKEIVSRVSAVREAVGPDVDVCVEVHRKLAPSEAVIVEQALRPFNLLFIEDPIQPDSVQSMAQVVSKMATPVATGERLHTIYEFRELLEAGGAQHIKPDIGLAGGITHCKKIAALAEAYHGSVAPHNFLTPVCTAAHVHLCAAIPNFLVLAYLPEDRPPRSDVVKRHLPVEQGYIKVPDTPGLGVEFDESAPSKHPLKRFVPATALKEDGSVAYR